MSVTMQEQQLKEDICNQKDGLETHLRIIFNSLFKNIASPGFFPENIAISGSYLAISLIFFLDVTTDAAISFHILYVVPLTFIALHSSRTSWVSGAAVFSILLQCVSPFFIQSHSLEFLVCLFLLVASSNIICALIARNSRAHILEVNRLSTIDPLTHLYNRRGLDKALEIETVRQRRHDGCLSVVVLDVDGFKGLNDTMGHKAGDEALIMLSSILRNQIRQTDTIARVGGDEFVVLMPNTEASDCHTLCHLLCHTICVRLTEAFSYPLSASIGFTTSENTTEVFADMLSVADTALYRAKALGKNRVFRGYMNEFTEKSFSANSPPISDNDLKK